MQSQSQLAQGLMQARKEIIEECRAELCGIQDDEIMSMLFAMNEHDYAMQQSHNQGA